MEQMVLAIEAETGIQMATVEPERQRIEEEPKGWRSLTEWSSEAQDGQAPFLGLTLEREPFLDFTLEREPSLGSTLEREPSLGLTLECSLLWAQLLNGSLLWAQL